MRSSRRSGEAKISPRKIVHLWSLNNSSGSRPLDEKLDLSFYSLLFLAQALGAEDLTDIDLAVISNRIQSVSGEPILDPVSAVLLGPDTGDPARVSGNCLSQH